MQRILLAIGAITGENIEAGKTLIILDEIQESFRGLSVLKYFCENAPEYHVAVAGSLLGIAMHKGESFPVGKVDILHIYPMTFDEFLLAKGKEQMVSLLSAKDWDTMKLLRNEYIKALREYYFVGGMPEAVKTFVEKNDAIQWLMDAGLVYKSERVSQPKMPLKFYVDISSFKLFLLDCGLLGAMSDIPPQNLLVAENGMEESKGAFTENYVMSQLVAVCDTSIFYYCNDSKLEIDFLIQHGNNIVPIEAKAEENLRSKSLSTFVISHPEMEGLRFSMSDYREQGWMKNVPLYAIIGYLS